MIGEVQSNITAMGYDYPLGASFYEERKNKTFREWERFVKGAESVDPGVVPGSIVEAWRRCRAVGVNAWGEPTHRVLTEAEFARIRQENALFIQVSKPFLSNLYQFVKGSRFVVALFDRQGILLEVLQDEGAERENRRLYWYPGVQWDEKTAGNNAAGTVVVERQPIRIFSTQHYNRKYHHITASSAPIFAPDGSFLGGISLTAYYYGNNPHTLGMAVAAAQAIENGLRLHLALDECKKAFKTTELAYGLQSAVLSSIPELIMATDKWGSVIVVNDRAKEKFFPPGREVIGRYLRDVMGDRNEHLISILDRNEPVADVEVKLETAMGPGDYTLTIRPMYSSAGEMMGQVLILAEIRRIKNLVTRMIGAKAKFRFDDICGKNTRFLLTLEQAKVISQNSSNVLLLGESGTGKDMLSQAIHNASSRSEGPYVAINCAAIPRDLIASELFGYSEGAFTGSRRGGSQGKFELADGGTIFLDEIAEIPLELQSVLLRVIEDKSVVRIGGSRVRPVDVRVIAATNKDLLEEVQRANFRKDLYYRLNVFTLHLLPLSERRDDIPLLVDAFVRKYAQALHKPVPRVDNRVLEVFMSYSWPGNVRELQNIIERMMNYADSEVLTVDLLPQEMERNRKTGWREALYLRSPEEEEREVLNRMLKMGYAKKNIAETLGMSRTTLFRRLKRYGLA